MKRKQNLRFSALSVVLLMTAAFAARALAGSPSAQEKGQPSERPNILWIVTEDNGHHWVGAYGDPLARTPHIDKLAAKGVLYRYAYSNAPVCAPARSMLFTGMYSSSMGTHNMRSRYPIPGEIKPYVYYMREAGYYCTNNNKTDYNIDFGGADREWWDESSRKAHYKNRPDGKPFFAIFNLTTSHESNLFPRKRDAHREKGHIPQTPKTALDKIKLPDFLPRHPKILEDWATYYDIMEYTDSLIGDILKELEASGEADNTIVFYYSDHGGILPRAKRFTYDTGTHVPFAVHYPKKWEHLSAVKQGKTSDEVIEFVDMAPTLLSLAGVPVPDNMQGQAFAGTQRVKDKSPYAFLIGQRFDATYFNFIRGVTDGEFRYLRNFHSMRPRYMQTGYAYQQGGWQGYKEAWKEGELNDRQASYWTGPQPVDELYHTASDPWEVNNLAKDPKYTAVLNKMRKATLKKMREIRDTGVVPETMYQALRGAKTLHEVVQHQDFDYKTLLEFVVMATARNPKDLPKLEAGLKSDNPVIRYWSAFGCTMLGDDARAALPNLKKLLADADSTMRLAAGRATAQLGDPDSGVPVIVSLFKSADAELMRVQAFQNLDELGAVTEDVLKMPLDVKKSKYVKGYLARIVADYRERNMK